MASSSYRALKKQRLLDEEKQREEEKEEQRQMRDQLRVDWCPKSVWDEKGLRQYCVDRFNDMIVPATRCKALSFLKAEVGKKDILDLLNPKHYPDDYIGTRVKVYEVQMVQFKYKDGEPNAGGYECVPLIVVTDRSECGDLRARYNFYGQKFRYFADGTKVDVKHIKHWTSIF
jgi:hypothetical protein